jgi:hypothetical protein
MRPHADQTPGIGNRFGLLFANESRAHHLRHRRITAQLHIKSSVRTDDRPGRDLERGFGGLHVRMSKIDKHT